MPPKVYFGSVQHGVKKKFASFAAKVDRVIEMLDLSTIEKQDKVVLKMHLGNGDGYQTVPVFFIRRIVKAIKDAGGWPFITDSPTAVYNAADRGYTQETCGCPIIPITGIKDGYVVKTPVEYGPVDQVSLAGVLHDADVLFDVTHVKGHNSCGFGGAIKNLALGGFAAETRWKKIHGIFSSIPFWDAEKCTPEHAEKLVKSCPYEVIKYKAEEHKLTINFNGCQNSNCWECMKADEGVGSLNLTQEHFSAFNELMAVTSKQVIDTFTEDKRFYLSFLLQITPTCDCWGIGQPNIVNDIGVLGSRDIVAIETASLDLIAKEGLMEKNIPLFMKHVNLDPNVDLHPFQRLQGPMKDPYLSPNYLEKIGGGSRDYDLIEVLSPEETVTIPPPQRVTEKAPTFF
ncbi:MAG: DUF362 domain-containing protein [Candidatus Thorarchaeota archaeon]